jgi:hypothetical protein
LIRRIASPGNFGQHHTPKGLSRIGKTDNPYPEPIFQWREEDESLLLDSLLRLREFGDAAPAKEPSRISTLTERRGPLGPGKNRIK